MIALPQNYTKLKIMAALKIKLTHYLFLTQGVIFVIVS